MPRKSLGSVGAVILILMVTFTSAFAFPGRIRDEGRITDGKRAVALSGQAKEEALDFTDPREPRRPAQANATQAGAGKANVASPSSSTSKPKAPSTAAATASAGKPATTTKVAPSTKTASPARQTTHVSRSMQFSRDELLLLARLITAEAGGESYEGMVAVGAVVLNRIRSPLFPNTMYGVIYEQDQFEPVLNGRINNPPTELAIRAATDAINGWDPSNGALYFFNPNKAYSSFLWGRPQTAWIGGHRFSK